MKRLLYIALCVCIAFSSVSCTSSSTTSNTSKIEKTTATTITMAPKEPANLGAMSMEKLYYKPNQAPKTYFCDASELSQDQIVLLRCIQGLIAREQNASIYISQDENDVFWKQYLADYYGIVFKDATFEQLLGLYLNDIQSVVIYNPKKKYELPIAQTMASLANGVAVSSDLYRTLLSVFELKLSDGSITEHKVRDKCKNPISAIKWAKDHLLVDTSTHYLGLTSGDMGANDYLYATKSLYLYIDFESKGQVKALKKLMAQNHYSLPAVSFIDDDSATEVVSKYGIACQNLTSINNLTFFASFEQNTDLKKQPDSVNKGAEDGKIYMAINVTCTGACPDAMQLDNLLNNVTRGSVEISISLSPAMYELASPILNWCYTHRGVSTVFSSTDMGFSTIDPDSYHDDSLNDWMYINDYMLKGSRLNLVSIDRKFSEDFARKLTENQSASGYMCNRISESFVVNNTPFIKAKSICIYEKRQLNSYVLPESKDGKAQFLCLNLAVNEFDENVFSKINETIFNYQKANPGRVEFMQVDDLAQTMTVYNLQKTPTTTTQTTTPATTKEQ